MTSVSCSIRQVNRLRRAAERARRILAEDPDLSPEERLSDGWSTSPYDPHTLRRVGETLWLQAGFALHAYVFRAGSNGISGAVPADAPLVTPDGRVKLRPTAVVGAQHGGFTAGSSPASWGSIDECCVNCTIPDEDLVSVPDVAQPALSTREPAGVG